MEEATNATPTEIEEQLHELIPLNVIRTETVLSRLPIHNLAKKGSIKIKIVQKDENGKVDLLWEVSPSRDFGEPRALAYKLDTIVINRRIDEQGKPLPKIIRLGSLREMAQELELGSDTASARRAMLQNASAFITAKLTYRGNDKRMRRLETGFTRYSVVFTGEQMPDGVKADAVYLILNEPYREVLNNAPVRPMDYDYLRQLPPAGQRFYEILSRKIFGALKGRRAYATITYSEYCTFSAQRRYFERQPMQNQMNAIHREHKKFGYIASVAYTPTLDSENLPDWIMSYVPGPKAKAEYNTFTKSGRTIDIAFDPVNEPVLPPPPPRRRPGPRQQRLNLRPGPEPAAPAVAPELIAELDQWGIGETAAREAIASSTGQPIRDKLDWAFAKIRQGNIQKPAGFIIATLKNPTPVPSSFETRAKREERDRARTAQSEKAAEIHQLEEACKAYNNAAVDRHIAQHVRPEDFESRIDASVTTIRAGHKRLPEQTLREMAEREVRQAIAVDLNLPTFDQFCAMVERGEIPGFAPHQAREGNPDLT